MEAALPSLDVGKGDDGQTSRTAWGAKVGGVDGAGAAPAHGDDVAFSRRCCGNDWECLVGLPLTVDHGCRTAGAMQAAGGSLALHVSDRVSTPSPMRTAFG